MMPKGFRLPGLQPLVRFTRAAQALDRGTPRSVRLVEKRDFGPNPGHLRMFLYLPPSLPKNAPLVVILHGCTQSAAIYDDGAGWSRLAAQSGFAVLAPEQVRENNPNLCFNWFLPGDTARDQGEAASIRQMIAWAVETHGLDRSRIFITGLSAGGAMTAAILAAYPDVFAAGAIIAGLPAGTAMNVPEALASMRHAPPHSPAHWAQKVSQASPHVGPWPRVSIWQGDADTVVHSSNAEALITQWTHLHQLGSAPRRDMVDGGHHRHSWAQADGRVMVEAVHVAGMGHGTPIAAGDGLGQAGSHFLETGISSTARIAEFWDLAAPATRTAPRKAKSAGAGGVGDTLRRALQTAGLLKR